MNKTIINKRADGGVTSVHMRTGHTIVEQILGSLQPNVLDTVAEKLRNEESVAIFDRDAFVDRPVVFYRVPKKLAPKSNFEVDLTFVWDKKYGMGEHFVNGYNYVSGIMNQLAIDFPALKSAIEERKKALGTFVAVRILDVQDSVVDFDRLVWLIKEAKTSDAIKNMLTTLDVVFERNVNLYTKTQLAAVTMSEQILSNVPVLMLYEAKIAGETFAMITKTLPIVFEGIRRSKSKILEKWPEMFEYFIKYASVMDYDMKIFLDDVKEIYHIFDEVGVADDKAEKRLDDLYRSKEPLSSFTRFELSNIARRVHQTYSEENAMRLAAENEVALLEDLNKKKKSGKGSNHDLESLKKENVRLHDALSTASNEAAQARETLETERSRFVTERVQLQAQFNVDLRRVERERDDLAKANRELTALVARLSAGRVPESKRNSLTVEEECAICMERTADVILMPCCHTFCSWCIENGEWNETCPTCRMQLETAGDSVGNAWSYVGGKWAKTANTRT